MDDATIRALRLALVCAKGYAGALNSECGNALCQTNVEHLRRMLEKIERLIAEENTAGDGCVEAVECTVALLASLAARDIVPYYRPVEGSGLQQIFISKTIQRIEWEAFRRCGTDPDQSIQYTQRFMTHALQVFLEEVRARHPRETKEV